MDLATVTALLKRYPFQCLLCGTGKINYPKHVLEHINTARHRNACARNKVDLHCTSPDGSSCLTKQLKDCLFPSIEAERTPTPVVVDPLCISSACLSSSLAPRQLSALCDHVENLVQTLNVADVSSLLSNHGFNDAAWLHLSDNATRVKALCVHIMRTNNVALFQELGLYFEKRKQKYEEIYRIFQDRPFSVIKEPTASSMERQSAAEQEVMLLRAKMEQMSSELAHYRRIHLNVASNTNPLEETGTALSQLIRQEMSSLSTAIQEQTLALQKVTTEPNQGNCLKHLEHYADLILKSTADNTVVNPTSWLPLWPSPEGVYPTVDWGALADKQGKLVALWREMKKSAPPGMVRKLTVPQLRLAPSVCHGARFAALNMNLEKCGSSLTLWGMPVSNQNQQSCSMHMKVCLSLPTSYGKYQMLRRDSLIILETGHERILLQFCDLEWNLIDSERLPLLSVTLLPVEHVDEKFWWCGMPPVRADGAGVYPRVDWNSLGSESDWVNVWKRIVTTEDDGEGLTASNSLCPPPMYLPGQTNRVVQMYLTREQSNCIGLYTIYHDSLNGNEPLITNSFKIHVELELHMRNFFRTKYHLKRSHAVTVRSDSSIITGLYLKVEDWDYLDTMVLPVLSVTISDVN